MNRSHLHEVNLELGGRMVEFGGWEMPVQYESVLAEHRAVRGGVGFFDVSHLGRFSLSGDGAATAIDKLLCNNLERIEPGRAQYTMMLNTDGGVIDDIIVWWWGTNDYWILPNAANQPRVMSAFAAETGCVIADLQLATVMLAIQGPDAPVVFEEVLEGAPKRFRTEKFQWGGGPVWMAGTGYTGEKGGEVVTDPDTARKLVTALVRAGATPCGLGARDTLRLESGFPLWGQDLDESISPLEAGLDFALDFDHEFVGKEALVSQREHGVEKRLTGFVVNDRGVPRTGYPARSGDSEGHVTSGNMSPMLGKGIGMAYMNRPLPEPDGSPIQVEIRERWVEGVTATPPFHI